MKTTEEGAIILHVWDWMKASQCPNCEGILDANNRICPGGEREHHPIDEIDVSATREEYERRKLRRSMRPMCCPHCKHPVKLIVHLTYTIT